jgi:hypothetical protein
MALADRMNRFPVPSSNGVAVGGAAGGGGGGGGGGGMGEAAGSAKGAAPNRIPIPPIPQHFETLDACSLAQLQDAIRDPIALRALLMQQESVRSMSAVREDLYTGLQQLAQGNLAQRERSAALQTEVVALRSEVADAQRRVAELTSRQNAVLQRYSVHNLVRQLGTTRLESERRSEEIVSRHASTGALADAQDLDAFVADYVAARAEYHLRSAKLERLVEGDRSR